MSMEILIDPITKLASPLHHLVVALSSDPRFSTTERPNQGLGGSAVAILVKDRPILIDYSDAVSIKHSVLSRIIPENYLMVLKCQYRGGQYNDYGCSVRPFTYVSVDTHASVISYIDTYRELFLRNQRRDDFHYTLFARMSRHEARTVLVGVASMIPNCDVQMIGLNHGKHQVGSADGRLAQHEYFSALAQSRFALDAPGVGSCTHRMVEAWAMGQPLLMPRQKNTAYFPWNEWEHYIPIEPDGADLAFRLKWASDYPNLSRIIGRNGLEYYRAHCSFYGLPDTVVTILEKEGVL